MNIPTLSLSTDCKDVFNSFLVKNATYDGYDEIPRIITSNLLPDNLISFSTARTNKTKLVKKTLGFIFTKMTQRLNVFGEALKNIYRCLKGIPALFPLIIVYTTICP